MASETIYIVRESQRAYAKKRIQQAPEKATVVIREATRTDDQNRMMWPLLKKLAKHNALEKGLDDNEWKTVLVSHLKGEIKLVNGIDGQQVPIPPRTSQLSVNEFSNLIELILSIGAQCSIDMEDPRSKEAA